MPTARSRPPYIAIDRFNCHDARVDYGVALRVEFLIPGAATVVTTLWLAHAVGHRANHDPTGALVMVGEGLRPDSLRTVVAVLVMIAVTYMVGVVTVMATFVWPASRLVRNARARRLSTLQALQANADPDFPLSRHLGALFEIGTQRRKPPGPFSRRWWKSPSRWWRQVFSKFEEPPIDLYIALSLARVEMSPAAQSEFEYRRSVRQMALGMIPSVIMATATAEFTIWPNTHRSAAAAITYSFLFLAAGVATVSALMSTATYQENVAQPLLLDIAFLRYWDLPCDQPGSPTGDATRHAGAGTDGDRVVPRARRP